MRKGVAIVGYNWARMRSAESKGVLPGFQLGIRPYTDSKTAWYDAERHEYVDRTVEGDTVTGGYVYSVENIVTRRSRKGHITTLSSGRGRRASYCCTWSKSYLITVRARVSLIWREFRRWIWGPTARSMM